MAENLPVGLIQAEVGLLEAAFIESAEQLIARIGKQLNVDVESVRRDMTWIALRWAHANGPGGMLRRTNGHNGHHP